MPVDAAGIIFQNTPADQISQAYPPGLLSIESPFSLCPLLSLSEIAEPAHSRFPGKYSGAMRPAQAPFQEVRRFASADFH